VIYAMCVNANPTLRAFRRDFPLQATYLAGHGSGKVLMARHFYYLGDRAVPLPPNLEHLIIKFQGCKRVRDEDARRLDTFLEKQFGVGKHGSPNNPAPTCERRRRRC
jgi:hypothetical protein